MAGRRRAEAAVTQNQGQMRETYPVEGEVYRYRLEDSEGDFTFELEGEVPEGLPPAIAFNIESRGPGEGVLRPSTSSGWAGRTRPFAWAWVGPELHLWLDGDLLVFQRAESTTGSGRRRGNAAAAEASGDVFAPMPGAVLEVLVSEGDRVERNQTVVVMESMKMELLITAPRDGVVRRVSVEPGQQVERGMRLLELAPESDAGE